MIRQEYGVNICQGITIESVIESVVTHRILRTNAMAAATGVGRVQLSGSGTGATAQTNLGCCLATAFEPNSTKYITTNRACLCSLAE